MMRAAIAAPDAFVKGDRVGDWIGFPGKDGWETPYVHPSLVEAYGIDEALKLCVAYDSWCGCLSGLDEWLASRATEGSTVFVDGWLRPTIDRVPPCGWPADKGGTTDEHLAFVAARGAPFVYDSHLVHWLKNGDLIAVVPAHAAPIMAMRAAQRDLACMEWANVADGFLLDGMPWIPGRSPEGRHQEEERPWVATAAMWRGAVGHVLDGAGDEITFPEHPGAMGIRMKMMFQNHAHDAFKASGIDTFQNGPWSSTTISSSEGVLTASAEDGRFSWRFDGSDGTGSSDTGAGLSGRIPRRLLWAMRRVCAGNDVHAELVTGQKVEPDTDASDSVS
jgi:hypothetical protein